MPQSISREKVGGSFDRLKPFDDQLGIYFIFSAGDRSKTAERFRPVHIAASKIGSICATGILLAPFQYQA
jgi:hypothetical protein